MVLVNKRTGREVYIAKYYPSSGWYVDDIEDDLKARLNAAFTDTENLGMWGGDEWTVEYWSPVRELLCGSEEHPPSPKEQP